MDNQKITMDWDSVSKYYSVEVNNNEIGRIYRTGKRYDGEMRNGKGNTKTHSSPYAVKNEMLDILYPERVKIRKENEIKKQFNEDQKEIEKQDKKLKEETIKQNRELYIEKYKSTVCEIADIKVKDMLLKECQNQTEWTNEQFEEWYLKAKNSMVWQIANFIAKNSIAEALNPHKGIKLYCCMGYPLAIRDILTEMIQRQIILA